MSPRDGQGDTAERRGGRETHLAAQTPSRAVPGPAPRSRHGRAFGKSGAVAGEVFFWGSGDQAHACGGGGECAVQHMAMNGKWDGG